MAADHGRDQTFQLQMRRLDLGMHNQTAFSSDESDAAHDTSAGDELKMRRALGLEHQPVASSSQHSSGHTDKHPHKRRFVRDGEVPVVLVGRRDPPANGVALQGAAPVNKFAVAEAERRSEQEARQRAERALTEAQATIHDLKTKLGHAFLERDEARNTAQRLEADRRALTLALDAERDARQKAEDALETRTVGPVLSGQVPGRPVGRPPKVPATKATRPMTNSHGHGAVLARTSPQPKARKPERKPVKWWLTSTTKVGRQSPR